MISIEYDSMFIHQVRLLTCNPVERCLYLLALNHKHIPDVINNMPDESQWQQVVSLWECADLMGEA